MCQAESLTGIEDPILAGQELLREGVRTKWVIIKMGPKGSILITPSNISCAPAFKVVMCLCVLLHAVLLNVLILFFFSLRIPSLVILKLDY